MLSIKDSDKNFVINISILLGIIVVIAVGLKLLYLMDTWITYDFISPDALPALSQLSTSFGLILSIITIFLLYLNYTQQRNELGKLITQNKEANELQIILNEKITIDNSIQKLDELANHSDTNLLLIYGTRILNELNSETDCNYNNIYSSSSSLSRIRIDNLTTIVDIINTKISIITEIIGSNKKIKLIYSSFSPSYVEFFNELEKCSFPSTEGYASLAITPVNRRDTVIRTLKNLNEVKDKCNHIFTFLNRYK